MWAAFQKNAWLAVDFHVHQSMLALGWTNTKTAEEATYQILQLNIVALEYSIKLNDAFGSIGQITGIIRKKKGSTTRQLEYQNYTDLIEKTTQNDVIMILEVLREYFSE